jgi:hypothetical protein
MTYESVLSNQPRTPLAMEMLRVGAARKGTAPIHLRITGELVGLGASRLLVGHRTRTATTAARLFVVHAFATGVSVLTLFLLLAAGHICFAAVLHVAARGGIIIIVRGLKGKRCGRNSQGRSACDGDYKCFEFLHLYVSWSKNCFSQFGKFQSDSHQTVNASAEQADF